MARRRRRGRPVSNDAPPRVSRNPPAECSLTLWLHCAECNARAEVLTCQYGEAFTMPAMNRTCPRCGREAQLMQTLTILNADKMIDGLSGIHFRARPLGTKAWSMDWYDRREVYSVTGALTRYERVIDRQNNTYWKRYSDVATGRVVVEATEQLSQHKGRGSARPRPASDEGCPG